jgi:alkylated DNA nucleotide flippase Atl1
LPVRARIEPTAYELERVKSGGVRWEYVEFQRRSREVDQQRKQAMQSLNEVQQFIAQALRAVEAGQWTAHEDLAELAGTTAAEVAHFLATWKVQIPSAYRVLNADGSIPEEGMLNATYRGTDLRARLAKEGLAFDALGRADQAQRLSAEALKERLDALREAESGAGSVPAAKRAWLVRGANVDGYNLVPQWLRDEYVSLSASQLADLEPGISFDELRQAVDTAYQHKSYAYRGQRLEELDRFIRRMQEGDLLITPMHGGVYVGKVAGPARPGERAPSRQADLVRPVHWFNPDEPIDGALLFAPLPALLQSQAYVVDLTEAYDQVAALVPGTGPVREVVKEQRTLAFDPVTAEAAADLLMDRAELQKIADLLWERRQVIFYGPPGTGKTYLAKVFGELYFLLEYRDEAISLQYSPKEEFTLPPNLFLIGTINTADRSIARIDTAMRRRFAFIELDPRLLPVRGAARPLALIQGPPGRSWPSDTLNFRLADADVAIGPSYLMKASIYDRPDGRGRSPGSGRRLTTADASGQDRAALFAEGRRIPDACLEGDLFTVD